MALEPGSTIGRYVVRRKIAEGGMAEIYLAAAQGPEGFEKDVVIKRIRSFLATDPEFVQMFIAEARLASKLNHANIVQIFDFDRHEDSFYIAMEYVRGRSLWELRRRCREQMVPMPPAIVAQIGSDVARGLHFAHRLTEKGKPLGLVHRDVTPHNVLMSWEGAVKLTDFGIAKAGNKLTSPGMLKGKFAYMAPEQARGEDIDARTDVFALGIVLWEMLTGGRLFEGDSDVAVLRAVQHSNIAPPGRLNPDVHADLDAVVMRALDRDAAKRFQTAQELERALGQFILSHARSIDDTDVGAFLRKLYVDELSGDGHDRTASGVRVPEGISISLTQEPVKREPTAVLPGSAPQQAPPAAAPAPDEDVHAPTWVVTKEKVAEPRSTEKVPAVSDSRERPTSRERPALKLEGEGSAKAPEEPPREPTVVSRRGPAPAPQPPPAVLAPAPATAPAPQVIAPAAPTPAADDERVELPPGARGGLRRLGLFAAVAAGVVAIAAGVATVRKQGTAPPDALPAEVDGGAPILDGPRDAGIDPAPEDAGTQGVDAGAPPPPDRPTPPPARPDAGTVTKRAPDDAPTGILVITASPWANVFVNGEPFGDVAGSKRFVVPVGKHLVRFHHPRRTVEKVVIVRARRTQSVDFTVFGK